MRISASKLRQDLCRILDQALESGVAVEVIRRGKVLKIVPEKTASKLSRLKKRHGLNGDPEDIVHMDWLKEWGDSA